MLTEKTMILFKIISNSNLKYKDIESELSDILSNWLCVICRSTSLMPIAPSNSKCVAMFDPTCMKDLLQRTNLHPITRELILPNDYTGIGQMFTLLACKKYFTSFKNIQVEQLQKLVQENPSYKSFILSEISRKLSLIDVLLVQPDLQQNSLFMRGVAHNFFSHAIELALPKVNEKSSVNAYTIIKELIKVGFFKLAKSSLEKIKLFVSLKDASYFFNIALIESGLGFKDSSLESFVKGFQIVDKKHFGPTHKLMASTLCSLIQNKSLSYSFASTLLKQIQNTLNFLEKDHRDTVIFLRASMHCMMCNIHLNGYVAIKPEFTGLKNRKFLDELNERFYLLTFIAEQECKANDYESATETLLLMRNYSENTQDLDLSLSLLTKQYLFEDTEKLSDLSSITLKSIQFRISSTKSFFSNNSFFLNSITSKEVLNNWLGDFMTIARTQLECHFDAEARQTADDALSRLISREVATPYFSSNLKVVLIFKLRWLKEKDSIYQYLQLLETKDRAAVMQELALLLFSEGNLQDGLDILTKFCYGNHVQILATQGVNLLESFYASKFMIHELRQLIDYLPSFSDSELFYSRLGTLIFQSTKLDTSLSPSEHFSLDNKKITPSMRLSS